MRDQAHHCHHVHFFTRTDQSLQDVNEAELYNSENRQS